MSKSNFYRKSHHRLPRGILFLMSSVLMFSMATMITTTVAWFNTGSVLKFSQIEIGMNDEAAGGLSLYYRNDAGEIVPVDLNQDSLVDDDELRRCFPHYDPNKPFSPVTSEYDGEKLGFYTQDLNGNDYLDEAGRPVYGKYDYERFAYDSTYLPSYPGFEKLPHSAQVPEVNEDDYYQFEFYFHSDYDGYLLLNTTYIDEATGEEKRGVYIEPDQERNQQVVNAHQDGERTVNIGDLEKAVDSIRISFYSEYGYSIYDDPSNLGNSSADETVDQAGRLNIYGGDRYYDLNEDGTKERVYGSKRNENNMVFAQDQKDGAFGDSDYQAGNCFRADSQVGVDRFRLQESKDAGVLFRQEGKRSDSGFATAANATMGQIRRHEKQAIARLRPGKENDALNRVVVTMYCEGWDRAMTDLIAEACFKIHLSFTVVGSYHAPEQATSE